MHNIRAYLAIQLCTLLFGLSALIGEHVQSEITAVVFGRSLFALILQSSLLCLSDNVRLKVPWRDKSKLMLNGALLAGHWFCFFMGVREGGVAIGTLGFATFMVRRLNHRFKHFLTMNIVFRSPVIAGSHATYDDKIQFLAYF